MISVEKRDCQGSRRKYCLALYSSVPSLTYPLVFLKYQADFCFRALALSVPSPWNAVPPASNMLDSDTSLR